MLSRLLLLIRKSKPLMKLMMHQLLMRSLRLKRKLLPRKRQEKLSQKQPRMPLLKLNKRNKMLSLQQLRLPKL